MKQRQQLMPLSDGGNQQRPLTNGDHKQMTQCQQLRTLTVGGLLEMTQSIAGLL
jgi:hypothetical protein